MGFTAIVNSVDQRELTAKQKSELRKILKIRKRDLEKALADVEAALKKVK